MEEGIESRNYYQRDPPTLVLDEARQVDHHLREGGQISAETLEQLFELRNHENQQDDGDDYSYAKHGDRVEKGLLDLFLEGLGFFLVGRDFVEQRLQRSRLLAGL